MVSNIGKITNLAATPSTGLVDGSDKLHSGILKVLESFSQGDMCISHAGFTITDGGSYTQYNLAQPIKFLKKGEFVNHTVTLTEAYTSSPVQNASHTRYDWVLINPATPELVIVQGTAASTPTVADITAGYIPIALVEITAGTDDDKFDYSFQTYTLNITKKSLSIMHGGNEAGNITGDTDSIDIASTITNADINLTPNGQGDIKLGTLKIDGDQTVGSGQDGYVLTYTHSNGKAALAEAAGGLDIDGFSALGGTGLHQTQDHFVFSDNGTEKKISFTNLEDAIFGNVSGDIAIAAGGAATIQANSVELGTDTTGNYMTDVSAGTGIDVTHTPAEGSTATIAVDVSDFMTNGANNRIVTATGTDGMNAEANATFDGDDLTIVSSTNAKPLLTLENTTATSSAATPPTLLFKRSGTPAQSGDLGMVQFVGKDDGGNEHEYVRVFADMQDETNTTEDGRLIFNIGRGSSQANSVSNTEMLRLSGGEGVIFNHPKNNVDFEIRGDTNENLLFVDAGVEKVGILNGSPSATLDVTGSIAASTTITASTTVTGTASVVSGGNFSAGYEVLDIGAGLPSASPGIPTLTKKVIYSSNIAPAGNTFAMPNAVAFQIHHVKNIDPVNSITITTTGGETIDLGDTGHPYVTAPNTITLAPQTGVILQGANDSIPPLIPGWMIIGIA